MIDGNGDEVTPPSIDATVTDEQLRDILPVVRYIVPIPASTIQRSQGKYSNKYGYTNS